MIVANINASKKIKLDKVIELSLGRIDSYGNPFRLIDVTYTGTFRGNPSGFEDAVLNYIEGTEPSITYRPGHATFEYNEFGGSQARIPYTEQNIKALASHWEYGCMVIKDEKIRDIVWKKWQEMKSKMTKEEIADMEMIKANSRRSAQDPNVIMRSTEKEMIKPVMEDNQRLRLEKEAAEKAKYEAEEKARILEEKLAALDVKPKEIEKELKLIIPQNIWELDPATLSKREWPQLNEIADKMEIRFHGRGRPGITELVTSIKEELIKHKEKEQAAPVAN